MTTTEKLQAENEATIGAVALDRRVGELSCWTTKLYEQVQRKPLDLYWGRRGWCPSSLPRCVKRADFDELMSSGLVKVRMAQMIPNGTKLTGAPHNERNDSDEH